LISSGLRNRKQRTFAFSAVGCSWCSALQGRWKNPTRKKNIKHLSSSVVAGEKGFWDFYFIPMNEFFTIVKKA